MLCKLCTAIFSAAGGKHIESIGQLQEGADGGCQLCTALSDHVSKDTNWHSEINKVNGPLFTYSIESTGESGYQRLNFCAQIEVPTSGTAMHGHSWDISSLMHDFIMVPLTSNEELALQHEDPAQSHSLPSSTASTGDEMVFDRISQWVHECSQTHSLCGQDLDSRFLPKRLLDVVKDEPCLVLRDDDRPQGHYATLSHCWGPRPTFLTLTSDNLTDLRRGIPLHTLPQNFQDAISVTKRLNLRYLWIDSLCIMQRGEGSVEDWQEQAAAMSEVYENGFINIAADRASEATEGCFTNRNPHVIDPCVVEWSEPGATNQKYLLVDSHILDSGIYSTPLGVRAWVLQERLLSHRTIHFSQHQVFWECMESVTSCEAFPRGLSHLAEQKEILGFPFVMLRPGYERLPKQSVGQVWIADQHSWLKIVEKYTQCGLTKPEEDKLLAICGIAKRIAASTGDTYTAGFFRQSLPQSLLWKSRDVHSGHSSRPREAFRAPTWSWASVNVPVQFRHESVVPPYSGMRWNTCATVVDVQTDLVDKTNPYGQVLEAAIVLRGPTIVKLSGKAKPMIFFDQGDSKRAHGKSDTPELLFPISFFNSRDHSGIELLVLKSKFTIAGRVYQRIGMGYIFGLAGVAMSTDRVDITIV